MTTLAYPSAEFPAKPGVTKAITLQIPKDWEPRPQPGTVMAVRRVAQTGTFIPNVIVRIVRRRAGFTVTDSLTELKEYAATQPQGGTSKPFNTQIGGRQFVGLDVSFVDAKIGEMVQTHLINIVPSGSSVEVIQVIGGVGGAQAREDYKTITPIMKTLKVT